VGLASIAAKVFVVAFVVDLKCWAWALGGEMLKDGGGLSKVELSWFWAHVLRKLLKRLGLDRWVNKDVCE
jgi:hypothetical protein